MTQELKGVITPSLQLSGMIAKPIIELDNFSLAFNDQSQISIKDFAHAANNTILVKSEKNVAWLDVRQLFGTDNQIVQSSSFAFGNNNQIKGSSSFIVGNSNIALGNFTFVVGRDNHCNESQDTQVVFGNNNETEYASTYIMGSKNKVSKLQGMAFGYNNIVAGRAGLSFGYKNQVNGDLSTAFSESNTVSGGYSLVGGFLSDVKGRFSIAYGRHLQATQDYQAVFGAYNAIDDNAVFIIGGGKESDPYNLINVFTVKKDGSATLLAQGQTNDSIVRKDYVDNKIAELEVKLTRPA